MVNVQRGVTSWVLNTQTLSEDDEEFNSQEITSSTWHSCSWEQQKLHKIQEPNIQEHFYVIHSSLKSAANICQHVRDI